MIRLHAVAILAALGLAPTQLHAKPAKAQPTKAQPAKAQPAKAPPTKADAGKASPTVLKKKPPSQAAVAVQGTDKVLKHVCTDNTSFRIGRGLHDITGPAAEAQMMGYANADQITRGIHMRLLSRAFVIESPCNGQRVAIVVADLGMIFQSVKQGVVDRLKQKYGGLYDDANVLVSATHTHHGPAGYSHYALYNATGFGNPVKQGFDADNYEAIVDGIVQSIVRAHDTVTDGEIRIRGGDLAGASMNRSVAAYEKNPDRGDYATNVDRRMTLLRMQTASGGALGMINWFPVHPTSFSKGNRLVTGDNKGMAAFRFERDFGTKYGSSSTFVGAFANANEGDVSPNLWGPPNGTSDGARANTIAAKQYAKAKSLWASAATKITGGVGYRHRYADFSNRAVSGAFTGGGTKSTCPAALGIAFTAGSTEDGPGETELLGVPIHEGMPYPGKNRITLPGTPKPWQTSLQACHGKKDVLLPIGKGSWLGNPYPWTPEVLPVQLVTVGQLAIAAIPFECTTMCGRRIRKTILDTLGPHGIDEVVIAGLSNAYAGYVATKEEYDVQHYEGASTHFGPWTLAALQQELWVLADAMRRRKPVQPGPTPRRLGNEQIEIPDGVVFDDTPIGKKFGDVHTQPGASYARGKTVVAKFWAGHPKNNYRIGGSFGRVQRWSGGKWIDVANDIDEATTYQWKRDGAANSIVTITWLVPATVPAGTYRIRHDGNYKHGVTGKVHAYGGTTKSFTLK